ncbi:unnamed protein product [Calypogeia fissa]
MAAGGGGLSLLAACGGETVKLFDPAVETGDPCVFQYTPAPGFQVNCARWNHTNLVVASAGEDRKISMWMKNGQSVGVVPQPGAEADDTIDESILTICFSSKGSRYLASGGTGKVVRVWDMQRRRCIKWLKGHMDTITGVMYNCRDEHLASVSIRGDLILHNLASGTRAAELKDPHDQVLRVLEYSRLSRHLLVTAGDDGSVHIWDTTNRSPKVSWLKQHSAPTTGVCFSPGNDKTMVSVGLDKKLYTYDLGIKKPVHCVPFDAPFSSVAFKDDGQTVAAGTNSGRVVFYDIRGKPQPFTVLRAYSSSEAIASLNWQRSNPIVVIEATCTKEAALLGNAGEESVIMPDPLPASGLGGRGRPSTTPMPTKSSSGRFPQLGQDPASGPLPSSSAAGPTSRPEGSSFSSNHLWTNGSMTRLQTGHDSYNAKDDMEVFSPLVDVQPITPSLSSFYDGNEGGSGDASRKVSWSQTNIRKFPNVDETKDDPRITLERRLSLRSQDDLLSKGSPASPATSTPPSGLNKLDRSPSVTPPEMWGGDIDRFRQPAISRFATAASLSNALGSSSGLLISSRLESFASPAPLESSFAETPFSPRAPTQSAFSSIDSLPLRLSSTSDSSHYPLINGSPPSTSLNQVSSQAPPFLSIETPLLEATSLASPRRGAIHGTLNPHLNFSRGSLSPGPKKSLAEKKEEKNMTSSLDMKREYDNGFSGRLDAAASSGASIPGLNGSTQLSSQRGLVQLDSQQGSTSFALQLVQRGLEESLGAVQRAIHEDVQNLHLELLRQFHIQQTEMAGMMEAFLAKQSALVEEIEALRRENQQLRDMY